MHSFEDFVSMENRVLQEALELLTLAVETSLYHERQTGHEEYCPMVGTTAAENFLYLMAFQPEVQFVNPWHTFKTRRELGCFGDGYYGGYNYNDNVLCVVQEPMSDEDLQAVTKRTRELSKLWNRKHYAVISDLWQAACREARFKLVGGEESVKPVVPEFSPGFGFENLHSDTGHVSQNEMLGSPAGSICDGDMLL